MTTTYEQRLALDVIDAALSSDQPPTREECE